MRSRAMLGIDQAQVPSGHSVLKLGHASMRGAYPSTRHVFRSIWALTVLAIIWAGAIVALVTQQFRKDQSWGLDFTYESVGFGLFAGSNALQHFTTLILIMAAQALMTLGLHLAKPLIHLHHDEELRRMAGPLPATHYSLFMTGKGAPMKSSSFRMAFTSIPTLILLGFKSLAHFFFGRSINVHQTGGKGNAYIAFNPTPTYILAGCGLVLRV
jgi:hypothetical protein